MTFKKSRLVFLTLFATHFGLSLYGLNKAIECGALTCPAWVAQYGDVVSFPVFTVWRAFTGDGGIGSADSLLAVMLLNSVVVATPIWLTWHTLVRRVRRKSDQQSS